MALLHFHWPERSPAVTVAHAKDPKDSLNYTIHPCIFMSSTSLLQNLSTSGCTNDLDHVAKAEPCRGWMLLCSCPRATQLMPPGNVCSTPSWHAQAAALVNKPGTELGNLQDGEQQDCICHWSRELRLLQAFYLIWPRRSQGKQVRKFILALSFLYVSNISS